MRGLLGVNRVILTLIRPLPVLPRKTDMPGPARLVRFVPISEVEGPIRSLIGACEQRGRQSDA